MPNRVSKEHSNDSTIPKSPLAPCGELIVNLPIHTTDPKIAPNLGVDSGGGSPSTPAWVQANKDRAVEITSKESRRKSIRIRKPPTTLKNMVGLSSTELGPTESANLVKRLKKSFIEEAESMNQDMMVLFINWINSAPKGEIFEFVASATKVMNRELAR